MMCVPTGGCAELTASSQVLAYPVVDELPLAVEPLGALRCCVGNLRPRDPPGGHADRVVEGYVTGEVGEVRVAIETDVGDQDDVGLRGRIEECPDPAWTRR